MDKYSRQKQSSVYNERGGILTELAISLPLLFTLFSGSLSLGIILKDYQHISHAARLAARAASNISTSDCSSRNTVATEAADTYLRTVGLNSFVGSSIVAFDTISESFVIDPETGESSDMELQLISVQVSGAINNPLARLMGEYGINSIEAIATYQQKGFCP